MTPYRHIGVAIAMLLLQILGASAATAATPSAGKGSEMWGDEDLFLPENPLAGSALFFEKLCIKCHSIQDVGGKTGPDLGEIDMGSFSQITAKLWNHFPRMNEAFQTEQLDWPELDVDETRKLITFLYYLDFLDKVADPDLGERLFHEKNCVRCHSVGGMGGDVGPELDPFQIKYSVPFITSALWNSGPKMMDTMLEEKVPRPEFRERDVVDILAFIRSKGLSEEAHRNYLPIGNPRVGKKLFESKKCTRCHSIRGQGGTIGPDLAERELKGSLSYILSVLWNHGSNMWPKMKKEGIAYPEFEPKEMSDLISYLYFINFGDPIGSTERGRKVFSEKNCKLCHIPDEPGGETYGPNLAELGLTDPFDVLSAMWNHAPRIQEKMEDEDIRWPLLDDGEMKDIIGFILSLDDDS